MTETDFKLASPPLGASSAAAIRRGGVDGGPTNADEEDDAAYIMRVKTEMRKSGKRRDTTKSRVSPKGSIMKRRPTGNNNRSTSTSSPSANTKDAYVFSFSFLPVFLVLFHILYNLYIFFLFIFFYLTYFGFHIVQWFLSLLQYLK